MKHSDVTLVRIYLTEGEKLMKTLLAKLHDEEKVRGVTVFRGISGLDARAWCIPPRCSTCRSTCRS